MHRRHAFAMILIAAFALLSAAFKAAQGFVDLRLAIPLCLGALLGATVGAWMTRRFRGEALKALFGLVFLAVSARYILTAFGAQP